MLMTVTRAEPPSGGDEKSMLAAWLDYHRATLAMKCEGLSGEQLRQQAVPPSGLSLLGLVRHLSEVERSWFQRGVAGADAPRRYYSDDNPDGDFYDVEATDVAEVFSTWHSDCARAREIVAAAPDLTVMSQAVRRNGRRQSFTLRWIMLHMIEEYARHNGHADFLRERIDGSTGT
jgi:uncharacterized damage-inducible protein DinB